MGSNKESPKPQNDENAVYDWVEDRQQSVWATKDDEAHVKVTSGYNIQDEREEKYIKELLQEGGLLNPQNATPFGRI